MGKFFLVFDLFTLTLGFIYRGIEVSFSEGN